MTEASAPKRLGRPPKFAGEKTRGSVTIRMRDKVRKELEESAQKHGRSLSEEIETRMEISLAQKAQLQAEWGDDCFRIATAMATARALVEHWLGEEWLGDDRAAKVFELTAAQIVRNYRDIVQGRTRELFAPKFLDEMTDQELAEVFAAQSGLVPPRPRRAPVEVVITDD